MYRGALESKKRQLSANEHPLQLPSFFLLLLLLSLPSDHLHHELQLCSLMNIPRKKKTKGNRNKGTCARSLTPFCKCVRFTIDLLQFCHKYRTSIMLAIRQLVGSMCFVFDHSETPPKRRSKRQGKPNETKQNV